MESRPRAASRSGRAEPDGVASLPSDADGGAPSPAAPRDRRGSKYPAYRRSSAAALPEFRRRSSLSAQTDTQAPDRPDGPAPLLRGLEARRGPFHPDAAVDWCAAPLDVLLATRWGGTDFDHPAVAAEFTRFAFRSLLPAVVGGMYTAGWCLLTATGAMTPGPRLWLHYGAVAAFGLLTAADALLYCLAPDTPKWARCHMWLASLIGAVVVAASSWHLFDMASRCDGGLDLLAALGAPRPYATPLSRSAALRFCTRQVNPLGVAVQTCALMALSLHPLHAAALGTLQAVLQVASPFLATAAAAPFRDALPASDAAAVALVYVCALLVALLLTAVRFRGLRLGFAAALGVERRTLLALRHDEELDGLMLSLVPAMVLPRLLAAQQRLAAGDDDDGGGAGLDGASGSSRGAARRDAELLGRLGDLLEIDRAPSATVLFADMAGFTLWSSQRTAADVATMLNSVVGEIDAAAWEDGVVEKIKTVGDAYWAVAGLPEHHADHADRMVAFAQRMVHIVDEVVATNALRWGSVRWRIGVHSGRLGGAVLGTQQLSYEVFGPAQRVAEEAERTGVPGRAAVTDATLDLLSERPPHRPHRTIHVDGRHYETFLLDPPGATSEGPGGPSLLSADGGLSPSVRGRIKSRSSAMLRNHVSSAGTSLSGTAQHLSTASPLAGPSRGAFNGSSSGATGSVSLLGTQASSQAGRPHCANGSAVSRRSGGRSAWGGTVLSSRLGVSRRIAPRAGGRQPARVDVKQFIRQRIAKRQAHGAAGAKGPPPRRAGAVIGAASAEAPSTVTLVSCDSTPVGLALSPLGAVSRRPETEGAPSELRLDAEVAEGGPPDDVSEEEDEPMEAVERRVASRRFPWVLRHFAHAAVERRFQLFAAASGAWVTRAAAAAVALLSVVLLLSLLAGSSVLVDPFAAPADRHVAVARPAGAFGLLAAAVAVSAVACLVSWACLSPAMGGGAGRVRDVVADSLAGGESGREEHSVDGVLVDAGATADAAPPLPARLPPYTALVCVLLAGTLMTVGCGLAPQAAVGVDVTFIPLIVGVVATMCVGVLAAPTTLGLIALLLSLPCAALETQRVTGTIGLMCVGLELVMMALLVLVLEADLRSHFVRHEMARRYDGRLEAQRAAREAVLAMVVPRHVIRPLVAWFAAGLAPESAPAVEYPAAIVAFVVLRGPPASGAATPTLGPGLGPGAGRSAAWSSASGDGRSSTTEAATPALDMLPAPILEPVEADDALGLVPTSVLDTSTGPDAPLAEAWLPAAHAIADRRIEGYRFMVKIKTVGDTLMLGGPFGANGSDAGESAGEASPLSQAAVELLTLVTALAPMAKKAGAHVGAVQGAVQGSSRLAFDIFGDTVNTASRVMSTAAGGSQPPLSPPAAAGTPTSESGAPRRPDDRGRCAAAVSGQLRQVLDQSEAVAGAQLACGRPIVLGPAERRQAKGKGDLTVYRVSWPDNDTPVIP